MQALTYDGPWHVVLRDKPLPTLEHPRDALVRVTCAGLCGADLHLAHGLVPDTRVGATLGHEIVGRVEQVGPDVPNLQPGQRVLVPFNIACGRCPYCERGLTACCENSNPESDVACGVYGFSHTTGGYAGGQAEVVRVPFADVGPEPVPDDLSDVQAMFLTDALPTGYQAAEMCHLRGGESVAVFGAGPVGLLAMKSAWLMGAEQVFAVEPVRYRRDVARDWAGAEPLDPSEVDVISTLKELTNGRGVDASIEAVGCEAAGSVMQRWLGVKAKLVGGSAHALNQAFHATRKGGAISLVGVFGPPWNLVDIGTAMNKCQTIRTGQCSVKRYLPRLIEHVREGRLDPTPLLTHRFTLAQGEEAYEVFGKKQERCIKAAFFPQAGRRTEVAHA
jgi:threonine dehydrogenase-like Zn-dependent dehydrogenase